MKRLLGTRSLLVFPWEEPTTVDLPHIKLCQIWPFKHKAIPSFDKHITSSDNSVERSDQERNKYPEYLEYRFNQSKTTLDDGLIV